MIQDIKPSYVDFGISKLLKEKGFDVPCKMCVMNGAELPLPFDVGNTLHINSLHPYYSSPEQWQVVEWLRVNFGIHTEVSCDCFGELWVAKLSVCSENVWKDRSKTGKIVNAHYSFANIHYSPKDTYSAAFEYILNHLI